MISQTIFARVATILSYSVQTITAYVNSGLRINLGLLPVVLAGQRNFSTENVFFSVRFIMCAVKVTGNPKFCPTNGHLGWTLSIDRPLF